MSNQAAVTSTTNIVPVQGIFQPAPTFDLITLIGPAGTPFNANIDPDQSGLHITNSTIDSTTIGATTPSTGAFTSGTVAATPTGAFDLVNKQYVDYYAAGLSWKQPVNAASLANITSLSGLQTIDTVLLAAGDTILVKNQSTAADNGIYVVSAGAWTRSPGADTWDEFLGAITFVLEGSQSGSAWYCTAQPGGTLGVTALNWSNFSVSATYTAGTGLTLSGTQFSITPVGAAGTYGSASAVPVFVTNASGQVTSVTNTAIAIANTAVSGLGTMSTQNANAVAITGGTLDAVTIGGSTAGAITGTTITANTQFSGAGTGLTGTASGLSIGGNAATATTAGSATTATTATNLAGGDNGYVPYQTAAGATTFLATGSNGQVMTLAAGVPSWATPTTGTVTSVSGTGTVSGISLSGTVTSTGSLTLGGSLDLSIAPTIGNTTPNTGTFTTLTVNDNTTLGSSNTDTITCTARVSSEFTPATDNTYDLGRTGHEWRNLYLTGTANIDSLIADTADINAGTIDATTIGQTTPAIGAFTDLSVSGTISLAGSTGTSGYVLTSNGASAPTWQANASGLAITDDTTTNATRYLTFTSVSTGSITGADVSSTKLSFNPSTGYMTVTGLTTPIINNPTVTNYVESVVAIGNSSTSQTLSLTNGTVQTVTMTGNCTFTMPTATAGKSFILIISTGAGGFTGTFTSVKWPNNTAPTLTTTASCWDILTFVADGTNWYGNSAQAYA